MQSHSLRCPGSSTLKGICVVTSNLAVQCADIIVPQDWQSQSDLSRTVGFEQLCHGDGSDLCHMLQLPLASLSGDLLRNHMQRPHGTVNGPEPRQHH